MRFRWRSAAATRTDRHRRLGFVRRGANGQFKELGDGGRSLKRDTRQKAKRKVKSGQGDRGDT